MIAKPPSVDQSIVDCKLVGLKFFEVLLKQKRSYPAHFVHLRLEEQQPLKRRQKDHLLSMEDTAMTSLRVPLIKQADLSLSRMFIPQIIREARSVYRKIMESSRVTSWVGAKGQTCPVSSLTMKRSQHSILNCMNGDTVGPTQLLRPIWYDWAPMSSVCMWYTEERWMIPRRLELSPEDIATKTKHFFAPMPSQSASSCSGSYYQTGRGKVGHRPNVPGNSVSVNAWVQSASFM